MPLDTEPNADFVSLSVLHIERNLDRLLAPDSPAIASSEQRIGKRRQNGRRPDCDPVGLGSRFAHCSAKSTYDTKPNEVNQITADVVMIDQLLAEFGPEVRPAREQLRGSVRGMVQKLWNETNESSGSHAFTPAADSVASWRLVNSLPAQTDAQRALSSQIAQAATHLSQLRLLLFAQGSGAIPTPFLVILVFWLATIFTSFSLFGPMNATVLTFTFLFALSAAGAILFIYELNNPFTGMLQISRTAMLDALGATPP